jgi:hypothetical protein
VSCQSIHPSALDRLEKGRLTPPSYEAPNLADYLKRQKKDRIQRSAITAQRSLLSDLESEERHEGDAA